MEKVDLALLVALSEEYDTIKKTIGMEPYKSENGIDYFSTADNFGAGSNRKIAIHVTNEMGLVPTVSATDMLLDRVNPRQLISIGLSGQLSNECALGDVVIATSCDLANSEAKLSIGGVEYAGKAYEVDGLQNFKKTVNLTKYLQGRELEIPQTSIRTLNERRLWRKYPHVHAGPICSTDFVVDDPKEKKILIEKNRKFLCTDMESAAMVAAARK